MGTATLRKCVRDTTHSKPNWKVRFPEASKAIERVAQERQLVLPFPTDSEINVTNDPEPQPAAA
jgi:hypothetical protein